MCPKEELLRRVARLRKHGSPADTPLARFKMPRVRWKNVTLTMITSHLKVTVKLLTGTHLRFTYKDVSAQSLRASGAMAFLCSRVDTDIISHIGHWRSD